VERTEGKVEIPQVQTRLCVRSRWEVVGHSAEEAGARSAWRGHCDYEGLGRVGTRASRTFAPGRVHAGQEEQMHDVLEIDFAGSVKALALAYL